MTPLRSLGLALPAAATPFTTALAIDPNLAEASTRAAADAADEQLVEAQRAVWSRHDPGQKVAFARHERAWIIAGCANRELACLRAARRRPLTEQQ